uniref:RING-type domain-containing protein n=1 Tax=Macrostomum lignano TaxID=282301 RepID=A0A1I8G2E8_9PLAT
MQIMSEAIFNLPTEASTQLLAEMRSLLDCPACGRACQDPLSLEPCRHTVCRTCLPGNWEPMAASSATATAIQIRCPVCRSPCSGSAPYRSLAALANLVSLWQPALSSSEPSRLSLAALRRRLCSRQGAPHLEFRPCAVLHFPGPPYSLQFWPGSSRGEGEPGVAAIVRDVNNQRVWAVAGPAEDGESARPVLVPDLGNEEYTISGFCLCQLAGIQ